MTFEELVGSAVILCKKGVYYPKKLFVYNDALYTKHGQGYSPVSRDQTANGFRVHEYMLMSPVYLTKTGHLVLKDHPESDLKSTGTRKGDIDARSARNKLETERILKHFPKLYKEFPKVRDTDIRSALYRSDGKLTAARKYLKENHR